MGGGDKCPPPTLNEPLPPTHSSSTHLVSGLLQGEWSYSGVHLAVLVEDGRQATSRGPLQDETERGEEDANKLNDVWMTKAQQDGHFCSYLGESRKERE